jgi:hypothetical protein
MTSIIDHNNNVIKLNNCKCGAEPEYWSASGVAHEIVCQSCGRQTDMGICGLDAVHEWNLGKTYRNASATPIRSNHRRGLNS